MPSTGRTELSHATDPGKELGEHWMKKEERYSMPLTKRGAQGGSTAHSVVFMTEWEWVQCDRCDKWRRHVCNRGRLSKRSLPVVDEWWECSMHPQALTCKDAEEEMASDELTGESLDAAREERAQKMYAVKRATWNRYEKKKAAARRKSTSVPNGNAPAKSISKARR